LDWSARQELGNKIRREVTLRLPGIVGIVIASPLDQEFSNWRLLALAFTGTTSRALAHSQDSFNSEIRLAIDNLRDWRRLQSARPITVGVKQGDMKNWVNS